MESKDISIVAPAIVLEIIIGLFTNMFIVSVIFYDFYKKKHMSSSDRLLVCLTISNVSYNILMSAGLLEEFLGLRGSCTFDFTPMYMILLFYSISSCAWLTASLGAFYFINISQSVILSWVKFRISSIGLWTLLMVEVVSFINGSFSSLLLISSHTNPQNITNSPPSVMKILMENPSRLIDIVLAATFIPFMITFFSTSRTVWILKQHSQKIQRSMETVDTGRQRLYMAVVYRMIHFLFFYGIYYNFILIFYFSLITYFHSGFWVILLFLCSFTPIQSVLLILGNPRLKDVCKEMLPLYTFTRFLCGSNEG